MRPIKALVVGSWMLWFAACSTFDEGETVSDLSTAEPVWPQDYPNGIACLTCRDSYPRMVLDAEVECRSVSRVVVKDVKPVCRNESRTIWSTDGTFRKKEYYATFSCTADLEVSTTHDQNYIPSFLAPGHTQRSGCLRPNDHGQPDADEVNLCPNSTETVTRQVEVQAFELPNGERCGAFDPVAACIRIAVGQVYPGIQRAVDGHFGPGHAPVEVHSTYSKRPVVCCAADREENRENTFDRSQATLIALGIDLNACRAAAADTPSLTAGRR